MPVPSDVRVDPFLPMTDPRAVRSLLRAGATETQARALIAEFDTWEHLRSADAGRMLAAAGPAVRGWQLPDLPGNDSPLAARPSVSLSPKRTLLTWTRGRAHLRPQLAIAGAAHPAPMSLAVAAAAVFVAGRCGAIVATTPHGTLGQTVTRAAEMFGVPLTWVCERDPEESPWLREAARDLVRRGGSVRWAETASGIIDAQVTARLLVQSSCAVMAVDIEPHDRGGFPVLVEALRDGRELLVHADAGRELASALGMLVQRDLSHAHALAGIGLRLPGRDVPAVRPPVFAHPPVPVTAWDQVPYRVSEALRAHAPSLLSS